MSTTNPLYEKTRDGLFAALVGDQAFAIVSSEAGFRRTVEEWAAHVAQLADLDRRTVSVRISTTWGQSQHAVFYADGIIAHNTASHGGFALSPVRNRLVPSTIRVPSGFYEEDCAWVAVPVSYPELFTDFEKRQADDILRHVYPRAWEVAHSQVLEPGQSRAKDRDLFDRDNADRWVVISAIQSRQHPGFVECIAMLGGRRSAGGRVPADKQRRYLVDDALYNIGTLASSSTRCVTGDTTDPPASSAGPSREMAREQQTTLDPHGPGNARDQRSGRPTIGATVRSRQ